MEAFYKTRPIWKLWTFNVTRRNAANDAVEHLYEQAINMLKKTVRTVLLRLRNNGSNGTTCERRMHI